MWYEHEPNKRIVRSCQRFLPRGASKSSPCEHARHDAPTWSPRARPALRADLAVASVTRAGTWACPSPPSGPTTLACASQTRAPHRRTAWRGEALEDCQCRTRIWVCARSCSGRTGNRLGHAKRYDHRLATGRLEHSSRGNPTNSPWRSEGLAHTSERDPIRRRHAGPLTDDDALSTRIECSCRAWTVSRCATACPSCCGVCARARLNASPTRLHHLAHSSITGCQHRQRIAERHDVGFLLLNNICGIV
jgi:hypothetical protein